MTLAVYLGVTQPIKQTRYRPTGILSTMRVRPSHFLGLCHLRGDSRCGDKINSSPSEHGPLIKIRQFPTAELFVHPLDDVVQHFINFHELSSSVRLTVALWPESCTRRLEIKINYYSPTVRSLLQGMGETVVDQGGGAPRGLQPPTPMLDNVISKFNCTCFAVIWLFSPTKPPSPPTPKIFLDSPWEIRWCILQSL